MTMIDNRKNKENKSEFDRLASMYECGMTYDYRAAVTADAYEAIRDDEELLALATGSREDELLHGALKADLAGLHERLYDDDGVTGNGSGSYWCSRAKAAAALFGNEELAFKAMQETGMPDNMDPELLDCSIRTHILFECIIEAVKAIREEEGVRDE